MELHIKNIHIRRILGSISKIIFPGFSFCGKCNITWNLCVEKSIGYDINSSCFDLCDECFNSDKTSYRDLIYYYTVNIQWVKKLPIEQQNNIIDNIKKETPEKYKKHLIEIRSLKLKKILKNKKL